ncbi:hypothetical protein CDAR_256601 [Caerostris darwini]|uniref:Ankyrin repeat protein n=1 Tax=Caerostris darwini TaxID=1538125 RepID=A0AAV4U8P1_9ARAC|nr:hypothetical protein CDAR_256601 [Caerostris darwini]
MSVKTVLHTLTQSKENKLRDIQEFLKIGSNPNKRNIDGNTPLHLAVDTHRHNRSIIEELIKAKANVNLTNNDGNTPLHLDKKGIIEELIQSQSVLVDNKGIIEELIKAKANVSLANNDGNTPLHLAVLSDLDNKGIIEELIKAKANVSLANNDGNTPLHLAVLSDLDNKGIIEQLINAKANLNAANKNGNTPLHLAVRLNNKGIIEELIKAKANVSLANNNGNTPLHLAVLLDNMGIIEELIKAKANVSVANNNGNTPLHLAVLSDLDNKGIIEELIKAKANVSLANNDGNTPLHLAVLSDLDKKGIIKELIKANANVNLANNDGNTPLHLTVIRRKHNIVAPLIQAGANVNHRDEKGNSALHYAVDNCIALKRLNRSHICPPSHKHSGINFIKYLLRKGADINSLNNNKESSLMWAARRNDVDALHMLLKYKAKVVRNKKKVDKTFSKTALHFALGHSQPNLKLVYKLMKRGSTKSSSDILFYSVLQHIMSQQYDNPSSRLTNVKTLIKAKILRFRSLRFISKNGNGMLSLELCSYAEACYAEICTLRENYLASYMSFYDFAMKHVKQTLFYFNPIFSRIIFDVLLSDYFPIYNDFILYNFDAFSLREQLSKVEVYLYIPEDEKKIILPKVAVWRLSVYLSRVDIFHLAKAYTREVPIK